MTKQSFSSVRDRVLNAFLRLAQDTLKTSVKSYAILATLLLPLSVVSVGVGKAQPQSTADSQTKAKPQQKTNAGAKRQPTVEQRETWHTSIVKTARPKKGCFTATYPETQWREVPCGTAPNRPYAPRSGVRPQTVGNGADFSAQVTANPTQAEGSFDSVTGVTSENDGGNPNVFSLQLNTNPFTTAACNTAPDPACQGWEQFIYSNSGSAFIQYWLKNFRPGGTACPAGFKSFSFPGQTEVFCFINSAKSAPVPVQTIAALGQMKLDGAVAGVNGNADDAVTLLIGNTVFSASGDNRFADLTNGWRFSEFNVFGDFNGTQAAFNNGSTIVVRTAMNSGMGATPPTCSQQGFTGETNNLTLVSTPAIVPDVTWPSIIFTESNAPGPTPQSCANADSIGDTHIRTFAGSMYDFQASGDFVLAHGGAEFAVQTRQASGAPTWPNAAVNKAVATQMGKTRVAVYIEPTRLVIDGKPQDLADGKDLLLPTGVQISRRGNLYAISSEDGNSVRAVLNSTWMDIHVGLGHSPLAQAAGLLGNPSGNVRQLVTSKGAVLTAVSFTDLYHSYADSWRVQPRESLFSEETAIKPGIPDNLFFARQLSRQDFARARKICTVAGVKTQTFLDACTIDNAVLNDQAAAKVFVHAPRPRFVIEPVLRREYTASASR